MHMVAQKPVSHIFPEMDAECAEDACEVEEGHSVLPVEAGSHEEKPENDVEDFVCEVCPEAVIGIDKIEKQTEHSEQQVSYSYQICGKTFSNVEFKDEDYLQHHSAVDVTFEEKPALKKVRRRRSAAERQYKCDLCPKSFARKERLTVHYRIHTGEKLYSCEECNCTFTGASYLRVHMQAHAAPKSFECHLCGKVFSIKGSFTRHLNRHTGNVTVNCSVCQRQFMDKYVLKVHMRTHSKEKPFQCNLCGRQFTQSGTLKIHLRIHAGEKSFECTVCGKGFVTSHKLKLHTRVHTGEKLYQCDVCEKFFAYHHQMRRHKETNHSGTKPYQCRFCTLCFHDSGRLSTHELMHVNGPVHSCNQCPKSYACRSSLRKHVKKAHSGIRPYKCDLCDSSFIYKNELDEHKFNHRIEMNGCILPS